MEGVDGRGRNKCGQTADKLRRIADAVAAGKSIKFQINGYRVSLPYGATLEIDVESNDYTADIEVELRWNRCISPFGQN